MIRNIKSILINNTLFNRNKRTNNLLLKCLDGMEPM